MGPQCMTILRYDQASGSFALHFKMKHRELVEKSPEGHFHKLGRNKGTEFLAQLLT